MSHWSSAHYYFTIVIPEELMNVFLDLTDILTPFSIQKNACNFFFSSLVCNSMKERWVNVSFQEPFASDLLRSHIVLELKVQEKVSRDVFSFPNFLLLQPEKIMQQIKSLEFLSVKINLPIQRSKDIPIPDFNIALKIVQFFSKCETSPASNRIAISFWRDKIFKPQMKKPNIETPKGFGPLIVGRNIKNNW